MTVEADRCYPLETGGVLAGYVADNSESVLLHVIGPGPDASHRRSRFVPDHGWQCKQLDTLFEESDGKYVYLGDWHTHPHATGRMSWLDQLTLRSIAKHPDARMANPLMIIGGDMTGVWDWQCYQFKGDRILGFLAVVQKCDVHVFS